MNLPDVSIIGTGALGSALACALQKKDFSVKSVYNRTHAKSRALAKELGIPIWGAFPEKPEETGSLIILTVPDDSIATAAENLSVLHDDWSGYAVIHCSGSLPSSALSVLQQKGAKTAAFHPLQTFTEASSLHSFTGVYFSIEGDSDLLEILRELVKRLEAHTLEITPSAKGYLHAAAVMASNYLIALLHAAEQIARLGGIDDTGQTRNALLPLIRQSLENAGRGELSDALSGPVARGDSGTVRKHLAMLEPESGLLLLYKLLGQQALDLAKQKGTLEPEQISELEKLLST